MNDMENPMSVDEAAEYLGIAVGTLKNKCYNGEVPYYKPSGKMYFYKSELDGWIRGENNNKSTEQ